MNTAITEGKTYIIKLVSRDCAEARYFLRSAVNRRIIKTSHPALALRFYDLETARVFLSEGWGFGDHKCEIHEYYGANTINPPVKISKVTK